MTKKMMIGPKLKAVAAHQGYTQKDISEAVGISTVQLSRFFCGSSDLNLDNFITLLKFFDIDIEKMIMDKMKIALGMDNEIPECKSEMALSLFESLDELDQQTVLKNLLWMRSLNGSTKVSPKIKEKIEHELKLI